MGRWRPWGSNKRLDEGPLRLLAQTPEDILMRRTKHYLHLTPAEQQAFADWFNGSDLARAA